MISTNESENENEKSILIDSIENIKNTDVHVDKSSNDENIIVVKESKHKIKGKHTLKYDSIFKGKKKDDEEEYNESSDYFILPKKETFEMDSGYVYFEENKSPEEYQRINSLREEIYDIITTKTNINIKCSRRKPSRVDFNKYMNILVENLDVKKYSYSEIFIEFAFYFSDNIVNMFRLLDKKWGGKIATELSKKSSVKLDDFDFM
jgi:hypothetical protein